MTSTLLVSVLGLIGGLLVLRRIGRGRSGGVTAADIAVVLASSEIVQLILTVSDVQVGLGIAHAAVLPTVCLVGIVLVVAGSYLEVIAKVVTALGAVAAVADAWVSDGPEVAGLLVVTIGLLWLINRLVRLVRW